MGLFDRLFGGYTPDDEVQPDIKFGRYSDSYKGTRQYDAWDRSLEKFEAEEYLESYKEFFEYLLDEKEKNVIVREEADGLYFEVFQGSKKLTGFANAKKVKIEAKVAHTESLNVGFMWRLLEQNFKLKYSRFSLDDNNNIAIISDTYTLDGSPYKLYYAIREVATHADKQDDLLLDEFDMLQPVENGHVQDIPEAEKEIKYQYVIQEITKILDDVDNGTLDRGKYPGSVVYQYLNLAYKLDYLVKPEGFMMETLERLHRLYFAKDSKTVAQKNILLHKEMTKLLDRKKEDYFKEFYRVKSTFGITSPVNQDKIKNFIDGEIRNMDWYLENDYPEVALSIPGYIIGYFMFNFAVPKPIRELLHLYYQVTEADYFKSLGFTFAYYNSKNKKFNKKAIKRMLEGIEEANLDKFPKLSLRSGQIDFSSLPQFAKSWLLMIRNLNI